MLLKPILLAGKGEQFTIHSLGSNHEEVSGLQQLGCFEGATGRVVSGPSNLILQIGNTRLAISDRLARTIVIRSQ
jgi:Fe2+ transport system protein FeoA